MIPDPHYRTPAQAAHVSAMEAKMLAAGAFLLALVALIQIP